MKSQISRAGGAGPWAGVNTQYNVGGKGEDTRRVAGATC